MWNLIYLNCLINHSGNFDKRTWFPCTKSIHFLLYSLCVDVYMWDDTRLHFWFGLLANTTEISVEYGEKQFKVNIINSIPWHKFSWKTALNCTKPKPHTLVLHKHKYTHQFVHANEWWQSLSNEITSISPRHKTHNSYFAFYESHAHKYSLNRIRALNWASSIPN